MKEHRPNKINEESKEIKQVKAGGIVKRQNFADAKRKGWRLILRNLPFKTVKSDLQNVCSNFGPFTEIVLPPCKDKRFPNSCAGFAFVQFKEKEAAIKAKDTMNEMMFHGRQIAADWTIDKDSFETAKHAEMAEMKQKVKEEKEDVKVKEELEDEEKSDEEMEGDEGGGSDTEESEDDTKHVKEDSAVTEGRVIFIRNLAFDTTSDALKEAMSEYGDVKLAIICKYEESGHSKGTAFVHFEKKEDAEKCLEVAGKDGIMLGGRILRCDLAIDRKAARTIEKKKTQKAPNDKRNLMLLRSGIIREGTSAANGMSSEDADKRARLAEKARKKLANLHMFVSPTRIVMHNLPLSLGDKELRKLCQEAAAGNGHVVECRIWRDQNKLDDNNKPKSKGFGFVGFSCHSAALKCLQTLNNNPNTFSDRKRPIVEFSIENKVALQAREGRSKKVVDDQLTQKQVDETTKGLRIRGVKPLPLRMNAKQRHQKIREKKPKKAGKPKPQRTVQEGGAKKRAGKASAKTLAKYLALS